MHHCQNCLSGCEHDFARCSHNAGEPGEQQQIITFDSCCTNTNRCCNGFPITWPARPSLTPKMICKDCGCIYEMYQYADDCFPPTPDFSEIRKHGYEIQICQPNACNEIYFKIYESRCIPPHVNCLCPICRKRRRPGDHFRDCCCLLCISRRANCLNLLRRELLAKHRKVCCHCGGKFLDILPCCIPRPVPCDEPPRKEKSQKGKKCAEGDEECEEAATPDVEDSRNDEDAAKPKESIKHRSVTNLESLDDINFAPPSKRVTVIEHNLERRKTRAGGERPSEISMDATTTTEEKPKPSARPSTLHFTKPAEAGGDNLDEEQPSSTCPCHLYIPSYWEVKEPCDQREDHEKRMLRLEKEAEETARAERQAKNSGIGKFVTNSFSQMCWSLGPHVPHTPIYCPEPIPGKDNEAESTEADTETGTETSRDSKTERDVPMESIATEAAVEIGQLLGNESTVQDSGEKERDSDELEDERGSGSIETEDQEDEKRDWAELEADAAAAKGSAESIGSDEG